MQVPALLQEAVLLQVQQVSLSEELPQYLFRLMEAVSLPGY